MAFDLKFLGQNHLIGLSKIHQAVVEPPPKTQFGKAAEEPAQHRVGIVPMVALFEHFGFIGGAELTFMNWRYVGDWWAGKISSLLIISGSWEFYSEKDYSGQRWAYGPGLYDEITSRIESFRCPDAAR